jgi:hypothetical protein
MQTDTRNNNTDNHPRFDLDWFAEGDSGAFIQEASTLGFAPGFFPATITTVDSMGRARHYTADAPEMRDGEILWVEYHRTDYPRSRACLRVLND